MNIMSSGRPWMLWVERYYPRSNRHVVEGISKWDGVDL
jgi:hypothetical protein